jgi:glutaredoxin
MKRLLWIAVLLALLAPAAVQAAQKKVEVFVTSWCPYCRKLENFLKQSRIDYTRYDVENDEKGAAEFDRLGGEGVPVVRVGKNVIHGYDPEGILAALKADN